MTTTIYDVLEQLRASAVSEADKGSKFERLIRAYLRTDPVFADQFSDVWLWSEYPNRDGRPDTGIDLVARDRDTEHDVAIQCKFFAPDTYVTKPMIDSFLAVSGKAGFGERIIVSTSDRWNANAEDAIRGQAIPVRRIGMSDLEASRVDWSRFSADAPEDLSLVGKHQPQEHQRDAIDEVLAGFVAHNRGKLVMACGTGKTFASLKLAEELVGAGGKVLFLVPSISLLSQTVREWVAHADLPIRALAVCSDPKTTRKTSRDRSEDISVTDLALPATTDVAILRGRLDDAEAAAGAMTVVFATYQSIDVVARAQGGRRAFQLIVADEAHRTTGATLAGEGESAFVRVHDNSYLPASKRLYMTATPRIYDDSTKTRAGEANAVLASMDDESLFGPEFHRLGFGEAVDKGLLTDYKVLVLTVDETSVARTFQMQLSDDSHELKLDDAAKIVGCWNGLAKRGTSEHSYEPDLGPMRRAIAFAGNIRDSKRVEELFESVTEYYVNATEQTENDGASPLHCLVEHVDGTMNALERNRKLDWLKDEPAHGTCRILTNARCLSEGVDVPALDAVMFLSPRKSVVDIVQSVGRVMRLDQQSGKQFGYIILPIGIPAGMTPEEALRDNRRYAVVWEVLQALRAHDDRFDALVNRISLSTARDHKVNVIGVGDGRDGGWEQGRLDLIYPELDQWRDAIYARIVQKVGSREYWTDWARDVAAIAERQITRITALLSDPTTANVQQEFAEFLEGLRGNLNDGITAEDAIEMLAQHLITRPVFNALFDGDEFLDNNPVAQTMERMLAALDQHDLEAENESLHKFYESVRRKVSDVKDREGRQELVRRLYDTFFATAFKKTSDKLGIVYTPTQVVDFILRSADDVLRHEFGQGLTDEGVHILDGFTGTGTFLVRLIELGLIGQEDMVRKYRDELHANEILLLAYYIAAINIETTYLGVRRETEPDSEYESFPGLILTDTFQSWEDDDRPDLKVFPENNERLERLKKLELTVIVGNPPYSVGQDSANDANQNERYPALDEQIRRTYAEQSTSGQVRNMYDSYIRAIKWASLRIQKRGLIAYVTNGGFLDSNNADGLRKTLGDEFAAIHIFNLRGNARTAGEARKREGGSVFGGGSRAPVAITVLVKDSGRTGPATIHYTDIGDYLDREQKLAKIEAAASILALPAASIAPNEHGDWVNQRRSDFVDFMPLVSKAGVRIIDQGSTGVVTNRDAWVYNFSAAALARNVQALISAFNESVDGKPVDDPKRISWSRALRRRLETGQPIQWNTEAVRLACYRAFTKERLYFGTELNEVQSRLWSLFPTDQTPNLALAITGVGAFYDFTPLMVGAIPDLHTMHSGQILGRFRYEPTEEEGRLSLETNGEVIDGYRKIDNITDEAYASFQATYPEEQLTKDDIFFYVYGLLHSPDYRDTYAADLKKVLPRIPFVRSFREFVDAGRQLSDLHVNYEAVDRYPLDGLDVSPPAGSDPYAFFAVSDKKMRFGNKEKTALKYNGHINLAGIPEAAYRYVLGSRSAIEWLIDRYYVKADSTSGIVNDPNEWSREVGDPRYIIDLFARITTVSLRTMQIVDGLPPLVTLDSQAPDARDGQLVEVRPR